MKRDEATSEKLLPNGELDLSPAEVEARIAALRRKRDAGVRPYVELESWQELPDDGDFQRFGLTVRASRWIGEEDFARILRQGLATAFPARNRTNTAGS